MSKANKQTIDAYRVIQASSMFKLDGPDIDLPAALIALVEAIEGEDSDNDAWLYLGEGGDCCLSDFIPGAYWALTEWHAGQFSPEYAAMCALGRIFSPGMTCAPDSEDEPEYTGYRAVCEYFAARSK